MTDTKFPGSLFHRQKDVEVPPQNTSNVEEVSAVKKTGVKKGKKGVSTTSVEPAIVSEKPLSSTVTPLEAVVKPTTQFTQALAQEIVKNLVSFGQFTRKPFIRQPAVKKAETVVGENPVLVDTSVLIDGRIFPVVNSGFFAGTLIIPQFILVEVQHIADSADAIRRAKGRRGLDVANKLKGQKSNAMVKVKIVADDPPEQKEIDHKLVVLAKKWKGRLLTVDFNLAHVARAQGVKVININDLSQALKIALIPGEELTVKISHAGKEPGQGVGYLDDGTMVVVDQAGSLIGTTAVSVITKIHQTPAGQLFFGRLK